ncbi:MAG TPA: methyltransferase domain-containing protein [Polyangiaceae bacterium]|jgi:SAM-dependent methyltransferase
MSEERRAAPAPGALDTAATVPDPPPSATTEMPPVPSSPSLADDLAPPSRSGKRDSSPGTQRRRARMTLRIPDDEVTRPQLPGDTLRDSNPPSSVSPSAPPPAVAAATVPAPPPPAAEAPVMLMPMRIISIGTTDPVPPPPPPPPAPARSPSSPAMVHEDSWTPYQPSVADEPERNGESRARALSDDLIPIDTDPSEPERADVAPAVESAPESIEPDAVLSEKAPPPPPRAVAITEPEGEEVRFDDDAPTPAVPPVAPQIIDLAPQPDGERRSDPGAELSPEDVVPLVAPPPPMRPRLQSQPPAGAKKQLPLPPPAKPPLVIVPPHVGTLAPPTEGSGLRRKGRLWWEDLFNDDYLRAAEKVTDEQIAREVDFVEDSLGIERGGSLLDLACGTGRHAIELARRGYEVVGFDLSLAMLARAGDEAQDRGAKLNFVQGDMREMSFDEQFDGVYCWNTSFGYFEEDKNAGVIDRIHKSLRAGGLLLLDVVNRDFLVRQSPSLAWFEGDGCVCMDDMSVDFITSRMKVKRTMMLDDGRSREIEYSMRVYSLHELGKILHDHGFKVCEVSGRLATPGVYFGNESPRTIILAEKR